jgi:hypothetical protein
MREGNVWVGVNYLDLNTKMATPPSHWLARLYDFDNMLVVFPSFAVPFAYVLARRRQLTAGLTDKALDDTIQHPDTKRCLQFGLVPVSLIYKTGDTWQIDKILQSLKSRDTWVDGDQTGTKYADMVDAVDAKHEAQTKKNIRDDMYARSGDAWRSYQARTGQRNRR